MLLVFSLLQCSKVHLSQRRKSEDQIVFIGHYKDWAVIKKLSINQKTEGWEVSGILSGIVFSLVPKVFQFAGASNPSVDVLKLCTGKRKSYTNVIEVLKQISLSGNQFQDAFLLLRVMETIGYKPYANPEMLCKEYPDIKPPKVKGRKPRGDIISVANPGSVKDNL